VICSYRAKVRSGTLVAGGALFFRATDPELKAKVAALLRETNQQLKRLD
jgi:hypothetical protein